MTNGQARSYKNLLRATAGFFALAAVPALAQESQEPVTPSPEIAEEVGGSAASAAGNEIVVTASRVRASGFTAPTPTTVLGEEVADRTGATTVADILTQVPSFRLTGIPGTNVVTGALYANLRGLGPQRTLVLVNGRRHVSTFSDGTMDLGVIPANLIARTEVVTGGASASWGSDAVAGVVNVILTNDLRGIELEAQSGISTYGDARNYRLAAAAGTSFAGGRGHVMLATEYSKDEGILSVSAPYYSRPYGGRGQLGNSAFASNGLPGTIYGSDVRAADYTAGGLITAGPLRGTQFGVDGSTSQFGYGDVFGSGMIGGTSNYAFRANQEAIKQPLERINVFGRAAFDVTDSINLFVEGSYAYAISQGLKGYTVNRGALTAPNCTQTTLVSALGSISVPITNPYLPQNVVDQLTAAGQSCFAFGKSLEEPGMGSYPSNDGVPRLFRGVAGFDAELGSNWALSAYVQHGVADYRYRRERAMIVANFARAIDAVDDNGTIRCRVNADANPNNDDPNCAPFNLFGVNVASPEAIAYVSGTSALDIRTKQTVAAIGLDGPLFSLWSDPIQAAFGVEYRRESVRGVADPIAEAGGFQTGNRKGLVGAYSTREIYGELAIPLLKDVPFFHALSLNLAARYTDYSSSGGVTTWKAGATWDISPDVRLRATRSRDIRAGNLGELFTPTAIGAAPVTDPRTNDRVTVQTITTGNPTLAPEEANTLTAGIVLTPRAIPGLRASIDYYNIRLDGVIAALTAQQVVDRCFRDNDQSFCGQVTQVNNTFTGVRTNFANLNKLDTRGVDIELQYSLPSEAIFGGNADGRLNLSVLASYVDLLRLTTSTTTVPISPLGQYTNPKWTLFATTGYSDDKFTLSVEQRFFGAGKIDNTKIAGQASLNGANINRIAATWYTNLYIAVAPAGRSARGLELFGRVDNLFNRWPPFPSPVVAEANIVGAQGTAFDQVGRAYRVGARFKF